MQYGTGGMPNSCKQLRAEGHDWLVMVEAGFSGMGWGEDLEASQSGPTPILMLTLTLKIVPHESRG
jgi:hypothetical protein